jgi:integrase
MPRITMTDRSVQALKPQAGKQIDYLDARFPGFGIRVSPSGRRSWIVLYRFHGRPRRVTLGRYPILSLADARKKAKDLLGDVLRGIDPAGVKAAERRAESMEDLVQEYLERYAKPRKRSWEEDERLLQRRVLPRWKGMKAREVTRRDVRLLIDEYVERVVGTYANRIFAVIRKMFNFAIERDIVELNPCHGLRQPAPSRQRDRVLSEEEMRRIWRDFDVEQPLTAASFKLRLLTAQRGSEVLGMRWEDIDFGAAWWTIPPEMAKNGRSHRVPLSRQAKAMLAEIKLQARPGLWVFPNPMKTGPMQTTQKAAERVVKRTGVEFRQHDLRRTAASHMTGMGIPRLVVGKILNHVEPGVTAVYDRHSYDREKREALERWAAHLEAVVTAAVSVAEVVGAG